MTTTTTKISFSPAILMCSLLVCAATGAQNAPPPIIGDPGTHGTRVEREGLFANYFPSRLPESRAAILLLGGSEGGIAGGEDPKVQALAAEGFSILQLCYFGCPGTPPQLASVPLETFQRGLQYLRSQPQVDPTRIAIVGGSKGAEAALLVAAREPDVKAVVAGMPSNVSWPAVTRSFKLEPSWMYEGKPVPFLPYAFGSFGKQGVFGMYNDALGSLANHPDARIPVERIAASILLVCGESDRLWPACSMSEQIVATLASHNRPEPVLLRYKDAGHMVFGPPITTPLDPAKASAIAASSGGTVDGIVAARADSWPKVVAFLKEKLR